MVQHTTNCGLHVFLFLAVLVWPTHCFQLQPSTPVLFCKPRSTSCTPPVSTVTSSSLLWNELSKKNRRIHNLQEETYHPLGWGQRNKRVAPARMSTGIPENMECSEENVLYVLEITRMQDPDMFGRSPRARNIGIDGDVALSSLDGPFVTVSLEGSFWHRRVTVMTRVVNMLYQYIPEIAGVDVQDEEMLMDVLEERDEETGEVIRRIDRMAPDFNGDRETMEYNGLNPDDRGPFGQTLFG